MKLIRYRLAAIVVLLCSITANAHDFEMGGIYYNIISETDLTVEVTFRGSLYNVYKNEYSGAIVIPSTVSYNGNTYRVTRIGHTAIAECDCLTAISIPASVTNIESYAFFRCSSLTAITIPSSVTIISGNAFEDCGSLTSITIPESVTGIHSSAFIGCNNLTTIIVDNENSRYDSRNGCNAIISTWDNTLITGCKNTIIPESVTSIGQYAFTGCSSLTAITIPESVTSIGDCAFKGCSSLTAINIPESVTSIENFAFRGCSNLTTITIPESVTSIGDCAFAVCSNLTSINIPKAVTNIGDGAFSNCSNLTAITLPEGVTYIGNNAFNECSRLTSINIPEGVDIIQWNSFKDCISLNAVTIPSHVDLIESGAFSGCSSLTTITIPASVVSVGNSAFAGCSNLSTITLSEGVVNIGESTFSGCSSLSAITIPESVTSIGNHAFQGCNNLTIIEIPSSVTSIGNFAFADCRSLSSITIDEGVKSIGDHTFLGCNLTSVILPDGMTSIGKRAFSSCSSLTAVTIPASVTNIGEGAFSSCYWLKDVFCYAETTPSTELDAFDGSNLEKSILHIPTHALDNYKTTEPWSSFGTIVSLTDEKVTNITLSHTTAILTEGDLLTLTAIVAPDYATNPSIVWKSSNTDVALVEDNGVITAIAPGTAIITARANDGSGVSASCEITVEERITTIVIADPYTEDCFVQNKVEENVNITYTRNFRNTNWQALYIPFEIPVTEEFLADFEVADINDVRQYDRDNDGKKDDTVIEAFKQTKGVLAANYPYLIRAKEAGEKTITVTDATLYATEENSIDCSSIREKFTFTGTYSRLSSDELPQGQGYYALSKGVWQPVDENASLGAFRFYLKVESRDGLNSNNKAIRMRIIGEDGTSEISELELSGNSQQAAVVYDLQGRRINDTSNLKGLYLVNGKKVMF